MMRRAGLLAIAALVLLWIAPVATQAAEPGLATPIWVYNNWSAYDELSDAAPLTEELAMRELRQILRLRKAGVRIDYYVMDAFWFDPEGGYRTWRKETWPDGPDAWLAACRDNNIKPGLWFGTNSLVHLNPVAKWRNSLTTKKGAMALYEGGFLPDFMDVLQHWYDRGVRLFKFDFAEFGAAAAGDEHAFAPRQIRLRNRAALRAALLAFRDKNPDAVLVAFNGFVGDVGSAKSRVPRSALRWLDVFDALYAGDPRPSNVPEMNFWRSVDIYSDRMVRRFNEAGVPLRRIDSTGFMIGDTGTIYRRRTAAWQGMLLLMMARGGWVNTVHGNLEFLDDADLHWFAKAQALYDGLQRDGVTRAFGGLAGDRLPYGFAAATASGSLYTVVNPAQSVQVADIAGSTSPARTLGRRPHSVPRCRVCAGAAGRRDPPRTWPARGGRLRALCGCRQRPRHRLGHPHSAQHRADPGPIRQSQRGHRLHRNGPGAGRGRSAHHPAAERRGRTDDAQHDPDSDGTALHDQRHPGRRTASGQDPI